MITDVSTNLLLFYLIAVVAVLAIALFVYMGTHPPVMTSRQPRKGVVS